MIEGEELQGAKQNRVVNASLLIAGETETTIFISCVEEMRWNAQSAQFSPGKKAMHATLRKETRTFVVDRVNMLRVTENSFKILGDFSFNNNIRSSFKVMQDELYGVTIRISPAWTRYVGEKIWHESQRIQRLIDGGIEINFRVAGLDEIRQWVLGLGPEAEVVAPAELKLAVWQSLRAALDQYSGFSEDEVDVAAFESRQQYFS